MYSGRLPGWLFIGGINGFSDDFMQDGRNQGNDQNRESL